MTSYLFLDGLLLFLSAGTQILSLPISLTLSLSLSSSFLAHSLSLSRSLYLSFSSFLSLPLSPSFFSTSFSFLGVNSFSSSLARPHHLPKMDDSLEKKMDEIRRTMGDGVRAFTGEHFKCSNILRFD